MSGEKKNIQIGVVLNYVTQALSILISFFYVPFMLQALGKEEYGLYSIVQGLISYLNMTDIGIGTTAIRYNAAYIAKGDTDGQRKVNGMFLLIYCGIAAACVVIGMVLYNFLGNIYADYTPENIALIKTLFLIALLNLVITFVFKIFHSIISAHEKFIFQKLLLLIQTIANPICLFAVLSFGSGAIGLLIATTVLNLISGILHALYCFRKLHVKFVFKGFEKKLFTTILTFTLFIFVNTLGTQLFNNSDKVVLSILISAEAVAAFAVVQQLEGYYYTFSNCITSLFMPRLTKMVSAKETNRQELGDLFYRIGRIQGILGIFIFCGILAFGRPFIHIWLDGEYNEVYPILILILFPQIFGTGQSLFTQLMQAMNLHRLRSILGIGVAVLKVLASIVTIHFFGIWGCAIAYTSFYILRMIVYNIYYTIKSPFDVKEYWKRMFKFYLPYLLFGLVLAAPFMFIPMNGYAIILALAAGFAVLYILGTYFFFSSREEKQWVKAFLRKAAGSVRKIFKR